MPPFIILVVYFFGCPREMVCFFSFQMALHHHILRDLLLSASQVGEDEFGHMLADILKQNNVDDSGVRFDPNARTALAFVTLRADGEREFMFFRHPSADMLLSEAELDKNLIKKVKYQTVILENITDQVYCSCSQFSLGYIAMFWV